MLHVHYNQENIHSFNDLGHKDNFINYMLRTDRKQKWTNNMTPYNCYAIVVNGKIINIKSTDHDSRLKIKDEVNKIINGLNYDMLRDDEIIIYEDNDNLMTEELSKIFIDVLSELKNKLGNDYVSQSLAFAMHNDQLEKSSDDNYWVMHIHRLFIDKKYWMNNHKVAIEPLLKTTKPTMSKIEKIEYFPQDTEIISDLSHREKFLNYMFRTDKKQKWTNDNTPFNLYAVKQNNRLLFFNVSEDEGLEKRKEIKQMVMDYIENINFHLLRKNIIHIYARNKKEWSSDDFEEIFNMTIKKEMPKILNYSPEYAPKNIAFAMHNDQAGIIDGWFYMHIHRLYFVDP